MDGSVALLVVLLVGFLALGLAAARRRSRLP